MTVEPKIRLLIADDHEIVLAGLRMVLGEVPDLEIVGEATTPADALRRVHSLRPDVVLMDVRFGPEGDASGIDACRRVLSDFPATRVIMFTSSAEREVVIKSVLAGASAFLTKNIGPRQLVEAIRTVAKGGSILDPGVTRAVIERLEELSSGRKHVAGPTDLTDREKEVLALLAKGLTNKQIAAQLYMSQYTARNYVIRILDKMGLSRRSEAAAEAVRRGLDKSP